MVLRECWGFEQFSFDSDWFLSNFRVLFAIFRVFWQKSKQYFDFCEVLSSFKGFQMFQNATKSLLVLYVFEKRPNFILLRIFA
jgi:hypothetical protein